MAAATGLIDAAEATRNPYALSFALLAYGFAFRDADPDRALDALRRGLVIAQDSGNRAIETHLAACLCPTRGRTRRPAGRARLLRVGDPQLPRLGQHHQASRHRWLSSPRFFDRLGRHEPAATIAGFALNSPHRGGVP